jgi:hypothetical protein
MKLHVPFSYLRVNRNYIEFEVKDKDEALELIEKIRRGEVTSCDGVEIDTGDGDSYDHTLHVERDMNILNDDGSLNNIIKGK